MNALRKGNVCRAGHSMTPDNTYTRKDARMGGYTMCKLCLRARKAEAKARDARMPEVIYHAIAK